MKTLITIPHPDLRKIVLSQEAIERLSKVSSVDWVREGREYAGPPLQEIISDYDIVISGWHSPWFSAEILTHAEKLKFFGQAAGTVIPFIDISAYDRDICIVNANKVLAAATAELTFALIMTAAWNIPMYINNARIGIWSDNDRETVPGLEKQSIGLIGLGEISRRLIKLLKPFSPEIYLYSRYCSQKEAASLGVQLVNLDQLLGSCRVISVHATLNESTRGMIGSHELSMIMDGAILVNTARAAIIEEKALIQELNTGRIQAALDVFYEEPLPREHPLLHMDNVICSPHIGGFSSYWKSRLGLSVVEDLERWLEGKPLENKVNREQYLRQTPK